MSSQLGFLGTSLRLQNPSPTHGPVARENDWQRHHLLFKNSERRRLKISAANASAVLFEECEAVAVGRMRGSGRGTAEAADEDPLQACMTYAATDTTIGRAAIAVLR